MASIIEFRIPLEEFALAETVEVVPDLHIEIERFVAQNLDSVLPLVWVTTDDFDVFEQALSEDSTVEDFSQLTESGEERLYRMEWVVEVEMVLYIVLNEESAIKSASMETATGSWELELLCPEHDNITKIFEFSESNGLSLTVDSIYQMDGHAGSEHGLTEIQHRSLVKANEMGYYDIPRKASLTDLSDELGISHQALSERLRRGHGLLIENVLESTDPLQSKDSDTSQD